MKKWLVEVEVDGAKAQILVGADTPHEAERAGVDHWLHGGGLRLLLDEHVLVTTSRAKTPHQPACHADPDSFVPPWPEAPGDGSETSGDVFDRDPWRDDGPRDD